MWCEKCGEFLSDTGGACDVCGTWNSPNPSEAQYPQNPSDAFIPERDRNEQVTEIKLLVLSTPFIIGCVLLTIGTVGNALANVTWASNASLTDRPKRLANSRASIPNFWKSSLTTFVTLLKFVSA